MATLESAKSHDLLTQQLKLSDNDPSVHSGTSSQDSGERKLAALGYTQELNRGFSTFTNFAVSFSIISILTGITGIHGCSACPMLSHATVFESVQYSVAQAVPQCPQLSMCLECCCICLHLMMTIYLFSCSTQFQLKFKKVNQILGPCCFS